MMRQSIKDHNIGLSKSFTYRGIQQTRIETFSDAVFALAVTLLILNSKVPDTFEEMYISFFDLVPFAICITFLALIWWEHYIFFIRYGLKDAKTVALNMLLLFLVLFYVYPLKFLFKMLATLFFGSITNNQQMLNNLFDNMLPEEYLLTLMWVYGTGALLIYLVLAWLYHYAYSKSDELELTSEEKFETRTSFYGNLCSAVPPTLSLLILLIFPDGTATFKWSGFIYISYPVILPTFYYLRSKKQKKLYIPAQDSMIS